MLLVTTLVLLPCLAMTMEDLEVQEIEYVSQMNMRLSGHVFNTTNGNDPQHCLTDCWVQNDICQSFNFFVDDKICELNDASHETHPADYGSHSRCVYLQNPAYGEETPEMERNNFASTPPSPCESDPCENDGECIEDEKLGFRCINCYGVFYGKFCELRKDLCHPMPCMNGGKCSMTDEGFNCSCLFGTEGDRCEKFLGEHKYDMTFESGRKDVKFRIDYLNGLTDMTLCFWYKTSQVISYFLSYTPDDPQQNQRIVVWKNDTKIHVSLGTNHEETFDNFQGQDTGCNLCISLNISGEQLNVFVAGAIRNDPKSYTNGTFQLAPGTLHLGYYDHPTDGSQYFVGSISQLNMWDHVKNASEIQTTNTTCLKGPGTEGLLWNWDATIWNNSALKRAWREPGIECATRAEISKDFQYVHLDNFGGIMSYLQSASKDPVESFDSYTISVWVTMSSIIHGDGDKYRTVLRISKSQGVELLVSIKNIIHRFEVVHQSQVATFNMPAFIDNKWHHFILTWSSASGELTLLIDAVFRGQRQFNAERIGSITNVRVGNSQTVNQFYGRVSNVNIWRRVLPDAYIMAMSKYGGFDVGDLLSWKDLHYIGNSSGKSMEAYEPDRSSLNALRFDSAVDTVKVMVSDRPVADMITACFWFRLSSLDSAKVIIDSTDFRITIFPTRKIKLSIRGSRITLKTLDQKNLNDWNHFCAAWTNSGTTSYSLGFDAGFYDGAFMSGQHIDVNGIWQIGPHYGKSEEEHFGNVNIWSDFLDTIVMKELARGCARDHGNLIGWSQFLQASIAVEKVSVFYPIMIVLPNYVVQKERDSHCFGLGISGCSHRYARTFYGSEHFYGWYCFCKDGLDAVLNARFSPSPESYSRRSYVSTIN